MALSSATLGFIKNSNKVRFLVVGRGAMGLLHAKYLEDAGHPVALYSPHDLHRRENLYGVKKNQKLETLQAKCVDEDEAKQFLHGDNKLLSCIFVAVKVHHIQSALMPMADSIPNVSSVLLLHNGLLDSVTRDFLDELAPFSRATMVTSRGSTLISRDETPPMFAKVAQEMGTGSAFVFPRTNSLTAEARTVLRTVACDPSLPSVRPVAFPECTLLTAQQGQVEQYLKLAVNIAINGLLARLLLRDWSNSKTVIPTRRLQNIEILPELPLAQSIARLVLLRAAASPPNRNNSDLQKAVDSDEAAKRVAQTMQNVKDNVCSTVADICSGRRTERTGLFNTLTEEWNHVPKEMDQTNEMTNKMGEATLQEASIALEEINNLLTLWDDHIVSLA